MRGLISKLPASWLLRLGGTMDEGGSRGDQEKSEETVTRSKETKTSSDEEVSRNWQLTRQILVFLGPVMATIAMGETFGYSAILLPQLKGSSTNDSFSTPDNSFLNSTYEETITTNSVEEESWVGASAALLMAPGCWTSGVLMERIGRRQTQLIIGPMFLAAWLLIGFSPNLMVLIVGRLISGFCIGLQGPLGPVYIAETSEPRLRGFLLSGLALALAVGILISHVLGTWFSWRVAAHLSEAFPFLCVFFCLLAPESPSWLIRKNRMTDAVKAWRYLRGNNADAEFKALIESAETSSSEKSIELSRAWRSPAFLKPLGIVNVFFFTAQFSGINAVTFYCVQMIADVTGPDTAHYATLILDVTRVVASFFACWLTRSYPRRNLVMISGIGTALSLLLLSGCLVMDFGTPWLPVVFLLTYICAVSIGITPIPWLLCGEIFPVATRGLGSGISSGFAFIFLFVVVKTSPTMLDGIGTPATLFFYGSIATLGTIFLYFFLPETKDKTLREIEEHFCPTKPVAGRKDNRV